MSTTAPQTRHTVTAIIVAHDGARMLPDLVRAIKAQSYPVEQVVGVDTGSRDRSGAVLAELIGQDAVFGMDRCAGYGQAVEVGLRHAARRRSGRTDPNINRVEWVWLLHDDCEPAPETLERLLRAASKDRSIVVLGPKVLDGQDRRVFREVGVSIDRAGRRVTGIDPGEIDQGQHDHNRAVLAVSSAGMLVRRDVWDKLGGFDSRLKWFRDDLDFCWRVHAAGYRVQVVPDAVLYHRELSFRRRRPTEGGNPRRIDRRNALYVLAVNLPLLTMLRVVGGCVAGSLVRAGYFLITKQLDLAAAHAFSVAGVLAHPIRLWQGRRRRAAGRAEGYAAVRAFIPPARTLTRLAEKASGLLSAGPQVAGGLHRAVTDEQDEEDEQFVDTQSLIRRFISSPGVQLFTVLLIVALVAERRLLGTSPLGGGALVPAWGGAGALWQEYLAGFHAVGVGSTASAPPYLAVVAALATVLGGQPWLAVDVLLLGCVPLAGMTAYLAAGRLVTSTVARVLLAASYALLPVAIGAVAGGRLGTAVAFILLPLIALSAARMVLAAPRQAQRAAWATGLLVAVATAFAPLAWLLALLFAAGMLAARRWLIAADPRNAAIVVAVPFFALFPWSLHLLTTPSAFLAEAGVQAPGLTTPGLGPSALLALSPGGPGLPPAWVTAGFVLALIATILPTRRAEVTVAGWCVAIAGFAAAVVVSRISLTSPDGRASDGWPGVALALAALGLLLAAAPAAQLLAEITRNGPGGLAAVPRPALALRDQAWRVLAGVTLAVAGTAPLLAAGYWVVGGVRGPVASVTAPLLPAFVSASSTSGQQYRTLILRPDGAGLDYTVVRQQDPTLGEPELAIAPAAAAALSREVAALGAPDGADAGDPGLVLGRFGIRWVMLPGPVDSALAQRLDAEVGLEALSKAPAYDLWQVTGTVARLRVIAADGTTTSLASAPVGVSGVSAPASGGTLVLAEPHGGWTATLNGRALTPLPKPVGGWAQGFVLPPGGGKLVITRSNLARDLSLILELIMVLAVGLLALPGKRADPAEEAEALAAIREARHGKRATRASSRARRPSRMMAGLDAVRSRLALPRSLGPGRPRRTARAEPGDDGLPDAELPDMELPDVELPDAEPADADLADPGWADPGLPAGGFADAGFAGTGPAAGFADAGPPGEFPRAEAAAARRTGQQPVTPGETGPRRDPWQADTWQGDTWQGDGRQAGTGSREAWQGDGWQADTWQAGTGSREAWRGDGRQADTWQGDTWQGDTWQGDTWQGDGRQAGTGSREAWPTGAQPSATGTGDPWAASWPAGPQAAGTPGQGTGAAPEMPSWDSADAAYPDSPETASWDSADLDAPPSRRGDSGRSGDPGQGAPGRRSPRRGGKHGRHGRGRGSASRSGADGES